MAKFIKEVAANYISENVKETMSSLMELACLIITCMSLIAILQLG